MGERIHGAHLLIFDYVLSLHSPAFFVSLGLGHEEASELHLKYYSDYGLALRGLTRHHDIGNVISSHSANEVFPTINRSARIRSPV